MMKRLSLSIITLGMLMCATPPAQAQQYRQGQMILEARSNQTDARVLFQAWRSLQLQNSRRIQNISLRERLNSRIEGPAGAWSSTVDMDVSGYVNSSRWQNNLTGFTSDGSMLPRADWSNMTVQWRNLLGEFAIIVEDPALPLYLFDQMSPTGDAKEERINGVMHWRIEMVPNSANVLYQRVTLWVQQEVGYLTRSRAVFVSRRSSIEVVTDYKRVNGIDVPSSRRFEGKVQTRRRNRISTLFFEVYGEYANYNFR